MKRLCCAAATALLAFASAGSFADVADFKTHVLDPPSITYPTYVVNSSPFQIVFSACQAGELPGNNTADGCFAGVNRSGYDWLGLQFVFSNTAALNSQPVDCSQAPSDNVYSAAGCYLDPTNNSYILNFGRGSIPNNGFFFVTEEGVDPAIFPVGTATVTASTATPEPSSLLLLITGLPAAGAFARRTLRRREVRQ